MMPPCVNWLQLRRQQILRSSILVVVVSSDAFDCLTLVQDCLFAWQWGVPIVAVKKSGDRTRLKDLRKKARWVFSRAMDVPNAGQGASRAQLVSTLERTLIKSYRNSGKRKKRRGKQVPAGIEELFARSCQRLRQEAERLEALEKAEEEEEEDEEERGMRMKSTRTGESEMVSDMQSERATTVNGEEEDQAGESRTKSITTGVDGAHRRKSVGSMGSEIIVHIEQDTDGMVKKAVVVKKVEEDVPPETARSKKNSARSKRSKASSEEDEDGGYSPTTIEDEYDDLDEPKDEEAGVR